MSRCEDGRQPSRPQARELLGAPVAREICDGLTARIAALSREGVHPRLAIVRVGERPGDLAYERGARKRMDSLGIDVRVEVVPDDVTQDGLGGRLSALSDDPGVHGVLLMRPLPRGIDEGVVAGSVPAQKDVDGMCAANVAACCLGDADGFVPCTAEAVIRLLEHYQVTLDGARAVVIGRSPVIGRPVSELLLARDATVTTCHSHTVDLASVCREADVVVAAAGRAGLVSADMVGEGATVVDVGMNEALDGSLVGDVDYEDVRCVAAGVTPVPRGVGSVTTSVLAEHVIRAAERLCV